MERVIEFYTRGPVSKKVNPVPIEQRGKLVEFPKEDSQHGLKPRILRKVVK